jgi:uncharacterized small protein (DUF1192 family)
MEKQVTSLLDEIERLKAIQEYAVHELEQEIHHLKNKLKKHKGLPAKRGRKPKPKE